MDRGVNDTKLIGKLNSPDHRSAPTVSTSSNEQRDCKINLHHCKGVVTWEDANHQERHTSDLTVDLYVDTTKQQAIFALRGFFFFKSGGPKAYLSLLIYPERIQSIELAHIRPPITLAALVPTIKDAPGDSFVSLRFTMTQPPTLMVPKDRLFEPKPRYQAVVDTVISIGSVTQFSIYLSDISPDVQQELAVISSIFSSRYSSGRLQTDEKRAAPNDLYEYASDHVLNLSHAAPESVPHSNEKLDEREPSGLGEEVAPPYSPGDSHRTTQSIGPTSRKRRASEPLIHYTIEKHSDAGSSILGYETPGKASQPSATKSVGLASPARFSTPCGWSS